MKKLPTSVQMAQLFALIRDGKIGEDDVGELLRPHLAPPLPRRSSPTGQTRLNEHRVAAKPWRFHGVGDQLASLRACVPHLDTTYAERVAQQADLPSGAIGIAVWPKITRLFAQTPTDISACYHFAMHVVCEQLALASLMTSETRQLVSTLSFAAGEQALQRYATWEGMIPGDVIVRPVWMRYANEQQRDMTSLAIVDAFAVAWFLLLQTDELKSMGPLLISTTDRLAIGQEYQEGFVNWEWAEHLTLTASRTSLPQDVESCLTFYVQP